MVDETDIRRRKAFRTEDGGLTPQGEGTQRTEPSAMKARIYRYVQDYHSIKPCYLSDPEECKDGGKEARRTRRSSSPEMRASDLKHPKHSAIEHPTLNFTEIKWNSRT